MPVKINLGHQDIELSDEEVARFNEIIIDAFKRKPKNQRLKIELHLDSTEEAIDLSLRVLRSEEFDGDAHWITRFTQYLWLYSGYCTVAIRGPGPSVCAVEFENAPRWQE